MVARDAGPALAERARPTYPDMDRPRPVDWRWPGEVVFIAGPARIWAAAEQVPGENTGVMNVCISGRDCRRWVEKIPACQPARGARSPSPPISPPMVTRSDEPVLQIVSQHQWDVSATSSPRAARWEFCVSINRPARPALTEPATTRRFVVRSVGHSCSTRGMHSSARISLSAILTA